jgi:hypothetical protein
MFQGTFPNAGPGQRYVSASGSAGTRSSTLVGTRAGDGHDMATHSTWRASSSPSRRNKAPSPASRRCAPRARLYAGSLRRSVCTRNRCDGSSGARRAEGGRSACAGKDRGRGRQGVLSRNTSLSARVDPCRSVRCSRDRLLPNRKAAARLGGGSTRLVPEERGVGYEASGRRDGPFTASAAAPGEPHILRRAMHRGHLVVSTPAVPRSTRIALLEPLERSSLCL